MATTNDNCDIFANQKVQIDYPIKWEYKVIGMIESKFKKDIDILLDGEIFSIAEGKKSSSNKYITLNIEVLVKDDDDRLRVFELLKKHKKVKFVL